MIEASAYETAYFSSRLVVISKLCGRCRIFPRLLSANIAERGSAKAQEAAGNVCDQNGSLSSEANLQQVNGGKSSVYINRKTILLVSAV
jgi:hypothetical protein